MQIPKVILLLVVIFLPYRVVAQQDCAMETYQKTLDIVFNEATAGKRVATIQVLRSFLPEWAIAFDATPEGLVVSRTSFRKQLWERFSGGSAVKTPSECVEMAKAGAETTPVPLPREWAQRFIDDLAKIDLSTDSCARNKNGSCVQMYDGDNYLVQLEDGRSVRLTDVANLNGAKSENPALSSWVTELLKTSFPPVLSESPAHKEMRFMLLIMGNGWMNEGPGLTPFSVMDYENAAHVKIRLKIVHLHSRDAAKNEYDVRLKEAVKIIEQGKVQDTPATKPASIEDRAVLIVPGTAKDCQEMFTIVATAGTALRTIQSCSLDPAIEFERQAKRGESVDDRWVAR